MKRATHRSSKGTKLYAVRDKSGKFKDIQTYIRLSIVRQVRMRSFKVALPSVVGAREQIGQGQRFAVDQPP